MAASSKNLVNSINDKDFFITNQLNRFIRDDYKKNLHKMLMVNTLNDEALLNLVKVNDTYEVNLKPTEELRRILPEEDDWTRFLLFSNSLYADILLNYAEIIDDKIIIRQPQEIDLSEIIEIYVTDALGKKDIYITSYNLVYYLLILFCSINIFLYIYLAYRKHNQ